MTRYIFVTDRGHKLLDKSEDYIFLSPEEFISNNSEINKKSRCKLINLCSDYSYLSLGYYTSLLADARKIQCIPSVQNIISLNWKRYYQSHLPEINALLEKHYNLPDEEPLKRSYNVYFGRTQVKELEAVARRIFDLFRFPLLSIEINYDKKWQVVNIQPLRINDIPDSKMPFFNECIAKFTGSVWVKDKQQKQEKYWLAILYDPNEEFPPSDKKALDKFSSVAKEMGIYTELITKDDYASLLEYDALFIRSTTSIDNFTFRFAHKAESEGIPSIDDTKSIIKCCNKVFLFELLNANKIPVPKTITLDKKSIKSYIGKLDYPAVVKIPDGSFSRGVHKVNNDDELKEYSQLLLLVMVYMAWI